MRAVKHAERGDESRRRVLVTGGNGLIGTAVAYRLRAHGVRVRALYGPREGTTTPPPGAEVIHGNVLNLALLVALVEDVDTIVHLAGPPSVSESFEEPLRFARDHVEGTAALLSVCTAASLSRFVYVSSAEIYGPRAPYPVREDGPPDPASPYAAAKLGAEAFVRSFAHHAQVDVAILRPFSVYGPGQSPRSLVAELVEQVTQDEPVRLRDPRPVRDFVHVRDVASALEAACFAPLGASPRTFNIGSGVGVSALMLARTLLKLAGRDSSVEAAEADRPQGVQAVRLVADTRRARAELGYRPTVGLEQGLRELLHGTRGEEIG